MDTDHLKRRVSAVLQAALRADAEFLYMGPGGEVATRWGKVERRIREIIDEECGGGPTYKDGEEPIDAV